jgi:hypothetical protein
MYSHNFFANMVVYGVNNIHSKVAPKFLNAVNSCFSLLRPSVVSEAHRAFPTRGAINLRSPSSLPQARMCLFSLQSLYGTKSLHTNSLKVQNAPNTNSRCCFQIIQKNVCQDHVFNLVLLYFSFCIILLWLALRSLSSLAPVIAAGHLPPRSLPGSSVLGRWPSRSGQSTPFLGENERTPASHERIHHELPNPSHGGSPRAPNPGQVRSL